MPAASGSDFFLNFGSNANVFAQNLSRELDPARASITALTTALLDYDEAARGVGGAKHQAPIQSLQGVMDQTAVQFSEVAGMMKATFDSLKGALGELRSDMSAIVTELNGITRRSPANIRTNVGIAGVTDTELAQVGNRTRRALNDVLEGNATAARNALRRVAEINQTLARNAGEAADNLKVLGQEIRGLSRASQNVSRTGVGGGDEPLRVMVVGGTLGGTGTEEITGQQVRNVARAVVQESALNQTAVPGTRYEVGGQTRMVGGGVQPGETLAQYHARLEALKGRYMAFQRENPYLTQVPEYRHGEGSYSIPGLVDQLRAGGGTNRREIEGFMRQVADNPAGYLREPDYFTKAARGLRVQPGAQFPYSLRSEIPNILQAYTQHQENRGAIVDRFVTSELQRDPYATFDGMGSEVKSAYNRIISENRLGFSGDLLAHHQGVQETGRAIADRGNVTREMGRRQRIYRETGRETDTTIPAERLTSQYALSTQLGRAKDNRQKAVERLAQAQTQAEQEIATAALEAADKTVADLRQQVKGLKDKQAARRTGVQAQIQALGVGGSAPERSELFNALNQVMRSENVPAGEATGRLSAAALGRFAEPGFEQSTQVDPGLVEDIRQRGIQTSIPLLFDPETQRMMMQGGHHRLLAAMQAGVKDLPVSVTEGPLGEQGARVSQGILQRLGLSGNAGVAYKGQVDDALEGSRAALDDLREAQANMGGGGGRRPPRPPVTAAGGEEEPDREMIANTQRATEAVRQFSQAQNAAFSGRQTNRQPSNVGALSEETQAILAESRALLANARTWEERMSIMTRAAHVFMQDPIAGRFTGADALKTTFREAMGLPTGANKAITDIFTKGGRLQDFVKPSFSEDPQYDRFLEITTTASLRLQNALLEEMKAENALREARANDRTTLEQLIAAQQRYNSAVSTRQGVQAQENPTLGQSVFGQRGFIGSGLRSVGIGIERFAGFQLAFSGFEQMKQLVDTAIQAQAAFIRLQASLDATGRSMGNLKTQLINISTQTGESLTAVIKAASELTGAFASNEEIAAGSKVSAMLANISQGELTAEQAAVALRDVTTAYGIQGTQAIGQVGDMIAHLSQITGVSVKDITEGTSQLAQEAKDYGLNQRQAAVLSAYITQATGETGEASAAQISRVLNTMFSPKTQGLLEKIQTGPGQYLATAEQFNTQGGIGEIFQNILGNWSKMSLAQQNQIRTSIGGSPVSARALAALFNNASAAAAEMSGTGGADAGSLAKQNAQYLNSLAGALEKLKANFDALGATMQRLGLFNLFGLLIKALTDALRILNLVGGAINDVFGSNKTARNIEQLAATLATAAVAFKIFGGAAGQVMGRINPNRPRVMQANGQEVFQALTMSEVMGAGRRAPMGLANRLGGIFTVFTPQTEHATEEEFARGEGGFVPGLGYTPSAVAERGRPRVGLRESYSRMRTSIAAEAEVTKHSQLRVAATAAGSSIKNLTGNLNSMVGGNLALMGAMALVGFGIDELVKGFQSLHAEDKQLGDVIDQLTGKTNADAAARHKGEQPDNDTAHQLARSAEAPGVLKQYAMFFRGETTMDPSNRFNRDFSTVMEQDFQQLRAAMKTNDPKKLQAAMAQVNSEFEKQAGSLIKEAGNKQQQKVAAADVENLQHALQQAGEKRLATLQGIAGIDQENSVQIANMVKVMQEISQLQTSTLTEFHGIGDAYLQQAGINTKSKDYKTLSDALSGNEGNTTYLQAQVQINRDQVKQAQTKIQADLANGSGPGTSPYDQDYQSLQQSVQNYQNSKQALFQQLTQSPLSQSQIDQNNQNNKKAIADLEQSNTALQKWNTTLKSDDPQYLQNLKQIQQNKQEIARLENDAAVNAATLAAASTADPLAQATANLNKALAEQKATLGGPHTTAQTTQAQASVDQARLSVAQAQEAQKAATIQAQIAGNVNVVANAQTQYNDYLRQENVYSQGALKNQTQYLQVKAQAAQAWLTLLQAQQDQIDSILELSQVEATTSGKDLGQRAAQISLQEAQLKVKQYLAQPGAQVGSAEYNKLYGQVLQAQRNNFDVALNAQLQTLDFQVATYKITSTQEIQALEQILKNKQLTLAEQQSITLKIKDLQTRIREELTGAGLNIPSDIKLPTAYEVRRSLGAGFANSTTQAVLVNNNTNQSRNTFNIQVMNNQQIQQVTNAVVSVLNQQSGQQARANIATPRLVQTRT